MLPSGLESNRKLNSACSRAKELGILGTEAEGRLQGKSSFPLKAMLIICCNYLSIYCLPVFSPEFDYDLFVNFQIFSMAFRISFDKLLQQSESVDL